VLKNALARRHQRPGACLEDDQTTTRPLRAAQRPQPWHGLSRATVRGLLSLDRFALCGPNATLTAARFQPCLPLVSSGDSVISTAYSTSVTEEDRHASTSTTIVADDISASFAAFVGIGPPQSERVETTQSLSSGTAFRRDQMVKTSVRVEGPPPATDQIEVFYDRLFGTFAYRAGNGFRRLLGTLPSPC
jgi:hypothetical protein